MPLQSINPTTEEVVATYTELSDGDVDTKLARAEEAFGVWKRTSFAQRKEKMLRLAQLLKQNGREIGMIATQEMGKPIIQAKAEVEKCAWVCEYYAENAEQILAHEVVATDASESYVQFDPIGVVLAVMPWNFPFWQVIRFIAPAAMAGNVGVLKHASNVQGCATKIEELFLQAGFPEGIFQNLAIGAAKVERVIQDSRVKAVTLTGSEYAGSQVAMHAGKEIKKTVLELGGSDPFIVLEDADLDPAVQTALMARLQNCGQSCIAAKRLILVESIADEFLSRLKTIFESAKIGDPAADDTVIGPLVNEQSLQTIEDQVQRSLAAGATLVTGGKRVGDRGFFYAPTILSGIKKGMPTYSEEVFGPVFSAIVVKGAEEAIAVANDTFFGLGASVWTQNREKAKKMTQEIESGCVFINGMVKSDPRLPFGGAKRSGYGRELSHYGIKEFVNIKTVWIK